MKDRRAWWTAAIAIVAAFWTYVLVVRPAHYDQSGDVFARIAFMREHPWTEDAETIAVLSWLFTYVAVIVHLGYIVALRAVRVILPSSSAIVTLGGLVMTVSTSLYMGGMAGFSYGHARWILPVELGSAVVVAVAGALSWRIARRDRALLDRPTIPAARATLR